jgi:hypothetical protein
MATQFFESFNAALPDLESSFTEDWILDGNIYPAIAIDRLTISEKTIKGGSMLQTAVTIFIREDVFQDSKVELGDMVSTRGQDFAVVSIDQDGDDSRAIGCEPVQIDVWK